MASDPDLADSDNSAPTSIVSDRSGGIDIAAKRVDITGDVIGRDKIVGYTVKQVQALLTQITSTFQPKPFDGRCPYLGLDAFSEDDADRFFGRETLIAELIERVKMARFLVIAGPSGSGKSSLVRAGLLHQLKNSALPNSDRWLYTTLTPGRDPIVSLALAVARMAKDPNPGEYLRQHASDATALHKAVEALLSDRRDQRAVIFVDQFEEIFTQGSKESDRVAFLNLLTTAATTTEGGRITVLFAMRSDFVANCATYPQMNALLNQQFLQVGAMQPDELVSAIARPALEVGLRIDPDLVKQIVDDMGDEPGVLPLMQFALKDLFDAEQAKGGMIALTLNDYLARGGLRKALERHADAAFAKLSATEQQLARSIFAGLIEIGSGRADTRRTASFAELVPASAAADPVQAVVQKLAAARLITTAEQDHQESVTISHERLIDAWPWLRKLIDENREAIALQNEIAGDAQEWNDHDRDASYLYTGARLATAREKLTAKKIVLNELARAYVEAGIQAERNELEEVKQRAARLRRRAIYLAGALVIAVIAAGIAVLFGIESQRQARISFFQKLVADGVIASLQAKPNLGALLSLESVRLGLEAGVSDKSAADIFWPTFAQTGGYILGPNYVDSLAITPDNHWLVAGLQDGTQLWNLSAADPKTSPIVLPSSGSRVIYVGVNNRWLITANENKDIQLWDLTQIGPASTPTSLLGYKGLLSAIDMSLDGHWLAIASEDGTIQLWNMTKSEIGPPSIVLSSDGDWSGYLCISPDGHWLFTSGESGSDMRLWDLTASALTLEPILLSTGDNGFTHVSISNRWLVVAIESKARLWDLATINSIVAPTKLFSYEGNITSIDISQDDRWLVIGSDDGVARLWDLAKPDTAASPIALGGGGGPLNIAKLSPDGRWLFTVGGDGGDQNVRLWDLTVNDPSAEAAYLILGSFNRGTTVATISRNSRWLVYAGVRDNPPMRLWMLRQDNVIDDESDFACLVADRNLTRNEWNKYFGDEPYHKTCPQWPAGQ